MEVNCHEFRSRLPSILDAISRAHFVTFDLELSGIPGQQMNTPRVHTKQGKPSLQQRYEESKTAAEQFHILQFGLTCVIEEKKKGVYSLLPYNFYLNPVPDSRLDVGRDFTYQSGAVEFLMRHQFRMGAPFELGIQYFSRREEGLARQKALAKQQPTHRMSLDLRSNDTETVDLILRARREINAWRKAQPREEYLNVSPVGYANQNMSTRRGFNNFQKRLIHQIVQDEYPDLVSIGSSGFVQVIPRDEERERAKQESRNRAFEEKLTHQIGLRWLAEAMTAQDTTPVDAWKRVLGPAENDEQAKEYEELIERLKAKRTVLVGHNMILDLMFFHTCFFGPLPDRVEAFQTTMSQLFSLIVDTKYMATHETQFAKLDSSSLQELDRQLSDRTFPAIATHPDHLNYNSEAHHEAGFDSFLTAKVLIRLSAQLETDGHYLDENGEPDDLLGDDEAYESAPEDGGVALPPSSPGTETNPPPHLRAGDRLDPFGSLSLDDDSAARDLPPALVPERAEKSGQSSATEKTKRKPIMMPPFDSHFWKVFGNKLRVNGTVEGVCVIGA